MAIQVVVPVLDEAERVGACVARLARFDEVVVVDGGSRDDTVARAVAAGARVIAAPRGRAWQLNAGAAIGRAPIALFLHADVTLPDCAPELIRATLAAPRVVAGAFRTRTVDDCGGSWLDPLLPLADLRASYTRLPYGDQALFVWRWAFERAGGYPEQPVFEDLELARRLSRVGRIAIAPASVRVSGRRFLRRPLRTALAVHALPWLYDSGLVGPDRLARWYGQSSGAWNR